MDSPVDATSVEAVIFHIHPLEGGVDIEARPGRDGKFTLHNVRPGAYSLIFPMPGRIEIFKNGSDELAPEQFELTMGSMGTILLVISMKSADVSVKVQGFPAGHSDVVARLAPADPHLTLRESCDLNQLSGPQTTFSFVPPGKYRIFILDARFQQDVAAYAPRLPHFLESEAMPIEVPDHGRTEATAAYLDGETIKEAIRRAGPLNTLIRSK